jgi:hypothetical protein
MKNPMRITSSAAVVMLFAIASSCAPEDKCGGGQFYDRTSGVCFPCPMNATFKNGTCKCKDSDYEFKNRTCVRRPGVMDEPVDAGASSDSSTPEDSSMSTPSGPVCGDYCGFANSCLGKNVLATSALPSVITGLHADDPKACKDNCERELGNDGSGDPAIACIEAGREAAMCANQSTQQGLIGALMLVGDCCRPRKGNALCKSICVPLKAEPLTSSMIDFCD